MALRRVCGGIGGLGRLFVDSALATTADRGAAALRDVRRCCASLGALAALLACVPVMAAEVQLRAFDIEEQELASALIEFAVQADVALVSPGQLLEGRRSPGVRGVLTASEALRRLLEGTGVEGDIDRGVLILRPMTRVAEKREEPDMAETELRNRSFLTTLIGSITSLAAGLFVTSASPQAVAQQGGYTPEEVVVTARRVEESLQRSPVSITNVTGDALFERDLGDISGVGKVSPNVNFSFGGTTSGSDTAAVVYIRGVGQNDFTPVTDPGVGVYVDGVYIARTVGTVLEALDLQRIEVMKGPQGTVFGRNTIGGAINLITRDPAETFQAKLRFTAGEDDRFELFGSVDLPISPTLRATVSGLGKIRDGYVLRPDGTDLGDDDILTGRVKLLWEPTEILSFRLATDYTRFTENSAPEAALDTPSAHPFQRFSTTTHLVTVQPIPPVPAAAA